MYRRSSSSKSKIGSICSVAFSVAGLIGCGSQPGNSSTATSFDGAWVWQENGEPLYNIVIEGGKIASLQGAVRNAKGLRYVRAITGVDSRDGLTHLSFIEGSGSRFVQFRFDEDSRGCTSDELCTGVRSENIYSKTDEIQMRISSVGGELVRR